MRRVGTAAVVAAAPLALAAALWFGSVSLPADEWFRTLAGDDADASREIV